MVFLLQPQARLPPPKAAAAAGLANASRETETKFWLGLWDIMGQYGRQRELGTQTLPTAHFAVHDGDRIFIVY
jgi:hypothetical protein